MSIEQRFYSCEYVEQTQTKRDGSVEVIRVPAITLEPMLAKGFSTRDNGDGDPVFVVGATTEGWAEFDALYPDQDAETGKPYRHRHISKDLPSTTFTE